MMCFSYLQVPKQFICKILNMHGGTGRETYVFYIGRDEMLTECARAWNKRKINTMVQYLCKRYHRVCTALFVFPCSLYVLHIQNVYGTYLQYSNCDMS